MMIRGALDAAMVIPFSDDALCARCGAQTPRIRPTFADLSAATHALLSSTHDTLLEVAASFTPNQVRVLLDGQHARDAAGGTKAIVEDSEGMPAAESAKAEAEAIKPSAAASTRLNMIRTPRFASCMFPRSAAASRQLKKGR